MSVHRYIHIGPYVECTYKPATRTVSELGCTNKACALNPARRRETGTFLRLGQGGGKFCSACGSPNGQVPVDVPDRPDYDVVTNGQLKSVGEDDDDDSIYLAANVRRSGAPDRRLDDESEGHVDIDVVDPAAETAWFETAFATELDALRQVYATVDVGWGIHQYFR